MCFCQFLKEYGAAIAPLIASIIALPTGYFIYRAWWQAKETLRQTVFQQLLVEYSSSEMAVSIRWLWLFYEECEDEADFVAKFAEITSQFQENPIEYSPHASHRRKVCLFYKRLATLYVSRVLPLWLIKKWWNKGTLEIIPKILVPIEVEAIPIGMGADPIPEEEYEESLNNMIRLYKAVKGKKNS